MKSYRSHFCHTAVAVLRQYFRVQSDDFSSLKNCHQSDPDSSLNCPILFPVMKAPGRLSHVLRLSCHSQLLLCPKSPQNYVVSVLFTQVSPPGFPGRAVSWCQCHRSATGGPWHCPASEATEMFKIKPSYSAGLIELK